MIAVRAIRRGEGALLLSMIRELAENHNLLEHLVATPEGLEAALFAPDSIVGCLFAEVDGAAAGYAFWHRSFATFRGCEVMYLEDLAVRDRFRRRGVGRALMRSVAALARERGYPSVYWLMMDWNAGAKTFYESLGASIEDGMRFCRIHGEALERLAV